MNTEQANAVWALEIETAMVSMIWLEPNRCADFLRQCDPAVHLTQPHLRIMLEAIGIAYGELNSADWATVVEVVRELGQFDEVGGLEGLNAVYSATIVSVHTEAVFVEYIRLLQEYARNRAEDPPRAVRRFSGGRGTVWRNKVRRRPNDPDFYGEAIVRGVRYAVRVEVAPGGDAMNLRLEPR